MPSDQPRASTGFVLDPGFRLHDTGRGHPEFPERLDAIESALERRGLLECLQPIAARPISDPELLRCHSQAYLHSVRHDVAYGLPELSTGDTAICDHSEDAARLAAGGALAAVEAVLDGRVRNAFAALRPPATTPRPSAAWASACSTTSPSPPAMPRQPSGSIGF